MKKIAYLTTQFNEVVSGPGRFAEYIKTMQFDGLELHFFSQQIPAKQATQHPVNQPAWTNKIPFTSLFRAWYFAKTLAQADRQFRFDYILAADYSMAMFLPKALLQKTFMMVNDPKLLNVFSETESEKGISLRKRWSRMLGHYMEKRLARKVPITVSNSLYTSGLIHKQYGLPNHKIRLLYKAVDLSYFTYQPPSFRQARRFLFIKNDWHIGGLDFIIEALARLPFQAETVLVVAGVQGKAADTVRALVARFGYKGSVEIHGLVKRDKVLALFREAHWFLNFSRKEALGVSCLEAMASGLPVLASNAGGLPEVLDFGNAGTLVPKENVALLTQALEELSGQPEVLLAKAHHALRHAQTFSLQALKQNFEGLFLQ